MHPQKYGTPGGTYDIDEGDVTKQAWIHIWKDSSCESFKQETALMTEEEANSWFCRDSKDAQDRLFKHERDYSWIRGVPLHKSHMPSHKILCKQYMEKQLSTRSYPIVPRIGGPVDGDDNDDDMIIDWDCYDGKPGCTNNSELEQVPEYLLEERKYFGSK
jgi:hypothetical protein